MEFGAAEKIYFRVLSQLLAAQAALLHSSPQMFIAHLTFEQVALDQHLSSFIFYIYRAIAI